MLDKSQELKPRIVELRRDIHRQPELGFDVHRTADLVARTLGALGIETQTGVGKTGVVGYLGDGNGPVVAIRADMDALPILEVNRVEYASQVPGKMHACGHDGHTSMLLGVAMLLAKEKLPGQIRLIFQPSEEAADSEGISGAPRMMDDGALKGVNAVIALHVDGTVDTGQISISGGKVSAACDTFRAHIVGTGGHGAIPHQANDPIWLTAQVLNALYAVPSRRIDPFQPSVLSLGIVRGGMASNVIPESIYIEGTLRSMDDKVREELVQEVQRCLEVARSLGGDYRLEIERGYPAMRNDERVADLIAGVGRDLLGEAGLAGPKATMGAEDFSFMTAAVPGAMFNLGVKKPGGEPRHVHAPNFDLDEDALPIGTAMLAETALRLLRTHSA
ncbi:MAG: amidohydrolase [Chloroflexi bacterium]|nr:amidohydrolase [Chloroflexota bacterium]